MKYTLHKKTTRIKALLMALILMVLMAAPQFTVQAAPNEVTQASLGIDVSRYQGKINWDMVAASGVKFAMIRVGYRTQGTGILNEDPYARYNLQEAQRVGLKVGAYFFSAALLIKIPSSMLMESSTSTGKLAVPSIADAEIERFVL